MRSVFKKMLFAVLPILIVITSMNVYFAGYQNYMQIIGEISEITGLPVQIIESEIKKIASTEQVDKEAIAKTLLDDMKNEITTSDVSAAIQSSGDMLEEVLLPSSTMGDIWFSTGKFSFYDHGHVGLYSSDDTIIEARGAGFKVDERDCSEITVKPGDLILGVSMFPGGTERASEFMRRSAVDWAKTKKGFSYAYTFNNKSCGNHDYNCSQLVWCAYRQTSGVDLDSDGTWFVSPSDIKDSEFTFIIWSY